MIYSDLIMNHPLIIYETRLIMDPTKQQTYRKKIHVKEVIIIVNFLFFFLLVLAEKVKHQIKLDFQVVRVTLAFLIIAILFTLIIEANFP